MKYVTTERTGHMQIKKKDLVEMSFLQKTDRENAHLCYGGIKIDLRAYGI